MCAMFAHACEQSALGDRLLLANSQIRLVGQLARQIRLVVTARSRLKKIILRYLACANRLLISELREWYVRMAA
jgi:hypothetical protein